MEHIKIAFDKNQDILEQVNDLSKYYRDRGIYVIYMNHDENNIHFKIVGKKDG